MSNKNLALMAHLLRRAGFGASRDELEEYAARGYDAVVDDLLDPERVPEPIEEDLLRRYLMSLNIEDKTRSNLWDGQTPGCDAPGSAAWIYRMVHSKWPLQEKVALFWHHVFATSVNKSAHGHSSAAQIDMFHRNGMGDLRTILTDLAKDPAMIYWLDNHENHKGEVNENWGRELLELFSMGVGNYTEDDVQMASRAFTGWTHAQVHPTYPYGRFPAKFVYREDDHDDGVKTFLGETGRFNGEDIIDIIVKQPATARFISRHLYNFFVADEPPVPAWPETSPQDPEAIDTLVETYFDSNGSIRSMLRVLFNSDFFKEARFKKVKSPVELVAGTIKLVGSHREPWKFYNNPPLIELHYLTNAMGQGLQLPPTVEGWHTGHEWIDGGSLNDRVNFAVDEVADSTKPGIHSIINRLSANGGVLSPQEFVDRCLDLTGPLPVGKETSEALLEYAESGGELRFGSEAEREESSARVVRMLQLIVASIEYQFA